MNINLTANVLSSTVSFYHDLSKYIFYIFKSGLHPSSMEMRITLKAKKKKNVHITPYIRVIQYLSLIYKRGNKFSPPTKFFVGLPHSNKKS